MSPKKLPDGSGFSIFGFEHWSLAPKETTQSTIVRKLSAQPRNSRAKRALGIRQHSSQLYLLDYIDCPSLQQHVQKALNRAENYHQLCRAIPYAGFGKLRFEPSLGNNFGRHVTA
jgi:TnpA family transposase